ncbi:MAG: zinc-ribbon domain-containing protein [Methanomassiliicoccales archaeon]
MADVLADPTIYAIMIILVILGAVTYYEIKIIRKRSKERQIAQIQVDSVYNQIVTSKAVSNALKRQGRNTKEADLALLEADSAFSRHNYSEARAALERAKELLRTAKEQQPAKMELKSVEEIAAPGDTNKEEKSCEVPFQEVRKMPKNFMESKFMICSVRDELEGAERGGKDVTSAKESLEQAERAFAAEEYTEALKYALRARKILQEPKDDEKRSQSNLDSVEKVPPSVVIQPPPSHCAKCQAELDPGDIFCSRCGTKIDRDIRCPRCSSKVRVDDAYCRKCGLPLRSD